MNWNWPEKTGPSTHGSEKRTLGKGVFKLCGGCGATHKSEELEGRFGVCPQCGHHHRLPAAAWHRLVLDEGRLDRWADGLMPCDPLEFSDKKPYAERIIASQKKSGFTEAMDIGGARLDGRAIAFGCFVFEFMGGS
ncbi:MAG: acetyl-CoA carboxylase carboxyl transferase subunit beta, partial [Deltaproteobacteria bacterium]|nr:acetyl-CoA carboxylase carboxyl transferase subunit beta [Deltaproteobacteria bacterium]